MVELLWSKCMKGQTLIEALVALGAAVIIVSAITAVVISALNNAQFSKNQNLATQFAQQGMEIMRQMRDSDWTTFNGLESATYCLNKESNSLTSYGLGCGQNVDMFIREVHIDKSSDSSNSCINNTEVNTEVTVSVLWSDNKCTSSTNPFCHKVELVSCFSDLRLIPTP